MPSPPAPHFDPRSVLRRDDRKVPLGSGSSEIDPKGWHCARQWWDSATIARPSPQTERLVDTVELLAAVPADGRTLAEIARHLDVDKATCYPMLVELTRVGWLVRHPRRKTFHLGPRLVAVGRAASSSLDIVDLARPRMVQLVRELDAPCLIVLPSDDELVVGDVMHPTGRRNRAFGLRAGDRIVVRPPKAAALVAWASAADVSNWIRRRHPAPEPAVAREYQRLLAVVRHRGYAVEETRAVEEIEHATTPLPDRHGSRRARTVVERQDRWIDGTVLLGELDPAEAYYPVSISAPVFDADGHGVAALCVVDPPRATSAATVAHRGEHAVAAAADITDTIHGRWPTP
jgi:DNA-binding IclR family transcriptional regulator